MADNKDAVQLAEYCFNVCDVVEAAIQGKNVNDLKQSARTALEDLGRYAE